MYHLGFTLPFIGSRWSISYFSLSMFLFPQKIKLLKKPQCAKSRPIWSLITFIKWHRSSVLLVALSFWISEFPEFLSNFVPVLAPSRLLRHWMLGCLVHPPSSPWYPSIRVKESTPGAPDWGNKADTYGMGRGELYFPSPLHRADATLLSRDSSNTSTSYSAFPPFFLFQMNSPLLHNCFPFDPVFADLMLLSDNFALCEWLLVNQCPHFSSFDIFSPTWVLDTHFTPFIS